MLNVALHAGTAILAEVQAIRQDLVSAGHGFNMHVDMQIMPADVRRGTWCCMQNCVPALDSQLCNLAINAVKSL